MQRGLQSRLLSYTRKVPKWRNFLLTSKTQLRSCHRNRRRSGIKGKIVAIVLMLQATKHSLSPALLKTKFGTPSYPTKVDVASLVDLLLFMLFGYDQQRKTQNDFMERMQEYNELVDFRGSYNAWFLKIFMVAYNVWTLSLHVILSVQFRITHHFISDIAHPCLLTWSQHLQYKRFPQWLQNWVALLCISICARSKWPFIERKGSTNYNASDCHPILCEVAQSRNG